MARIYTRSGDKGQTSLFGAGRVSKASLRIEAYGTVDELNAVLGVVRAALAGSAAGAELGAIVARVQNELFNLGSVLATPDAEMRAKLPQVEDRHVDALEAEIDRFQADLPELKNFILPGGGMPASQLHLARTVCRRAERLAVALSAEEEVDELPVRYLNRLSDALFVFARWAAHRDGERELPWQPG